MYKFYTTKIGIRNSYARKILLIMRLAFIIFFSSIMQLSATTYAQHITLKEHNSSLEYVLKNIRKQIGYDFLIDRTLLKNASPVNIELVNSELDAALKQLLTPLQMGYTINDKAIIIKQLPGAFSGSAGKNVLLPVHGKVTDNKGSPIPGVTIFIKQTKRVDVTDINGEFSFKDVPGNAILEFHSIGYKVKEVPAGDIRIETAIVLEEENTQLKEVAVISNGYQDIPKERSAGSFAKPDMTVYSERTATMNVLQRLDGLIPGLVINNSPSATTNPLLIRGLTSINGNRSPLYVMDGVAINDVSTINPNDVGSITVLKDATAASIWGARASNGVIVISTKKGGTKLKVDYDGFIDFQGKPNIGYFPVLNSQQFIDVAKTVFNPTLYPFSSVNIPATGAAITQLPPHEQILYGQSQGTLTAAQANAQLAALASFNNVSQMKDLFYRNALLSNQTVSISGGAKNYSAYGSVSYVNTTDAGPGDQNNRYKINVRQDLQVSQALKVYLITDLTNDAIKQRSNANPDDRFYPYVNFQNNNGTPASLSWLANPPAAQAQYEALSLISQDYNPINDAALGITNVNNTLARINGGVDLKIINGLSFQGTYGFVRGSNQSRTYYDPQSYFVRSELLGFTVAPVAPSTTPTYYLPATGGTLYNSNGKQQDWTVRNQLQYNKSWNDSQHQLSLLFGQEAQDQLSNSSRALSFGYNPQLLTSQNVDYKTLGSTGVTGPVKANNFGRSILSDLPYTETETEQRFTSYYANSGYTFNQKYTVNASWRIDRSNLFGKDNSAQNRPVWSAGGAWIASEEEFLKNVKWLNHLVVRTTYGITGNSPLPGSAASYDILAPQSSTIFASGQSLNVSIPANSKLTWETTATTNFGIDFSVLNNRLSGSVDLYNKNTKNLIGLMSTNSLNGYNTITGNVGNMKNRGVELSLNSLNVVTPNFSWRSLLTFAYNHNEVTQVNLATPIADGRTQAQALYLSGYPAFPVFAYKYAGLDSKGDPQIMLANGTVTKTRSISKPADMVYKGSMQPVTTGGFSNFFTYKNFGLNINTVYSLGAVMRRDVNTFFSGRLVGSGSSLNSGNLAAEFADRWQKAGDELHTNVPSYIASASTSTSQRDVEYYSESDINVLSADYIKLRDASLSYNLPSVVNKLFHVAGIKIRGGISNVMLWKANKYGIDPEFQNSLPQLSSSKLIGGSRTIPLNQHVISLGLHVSFN